MKLIPCKECLVKVSCIIRIKHEPFATVSSLQCPILRQWLNYREDMNYPQRLKIAYTELRAPERSPVL